MSLPVLLTRRSRRLEDDLPQRRRRGVRGEHHHPREGRRWVTVNGERREYPDPRPRGHTGTGTELRDAVRPSSSSRTHEDDGAALDPRPVAGRRREVAEHDFTVRFPAAGSVQPPDVGREGGDRGGGVAVVQLLPPSVPSQSPSLPAPPLLPSRRRLHPRPQTETVVHHRRRHGALAVAAVFVLASCARSSAARTTARASSAASPR